MEDLRKMLAEFDKTYGILQSAHVVPKYKEEGFLERIFSEWCTDGNKNDVLQKAMNKFKTTTNKRAISTCIMEKTNHSLNFIKNEKIRVSNLRRDPTYGTNEIHNFENVLSLYVIVWSKRTERS